MLPAKQISDEILFKLIRKTVIPFQRKRFNANFSPVNYERLIQSLEKTVGLHIEFRLSETPVFLPAELLKQIVQSAADINKQLLTPEYLATTDRAIPSDFFAPRQTPHPTFIQIDFAIIRHADGSFAPQLVELQGCASVHAFQLLLSQAYQNIYQLNDSRYLLPDLSDKNYVELLRRTIIGRHSPDEVVLLEVEPTQQKTRPDFIVTEQLLGVKTVAINEIIKRKNQLFYPRQGCEIPIKRIYNRVIVDELIRKNTQYNFDYRDELEVEWAGHPNWFFRLSKFSLPYLKHKSVPRSWFLNQLNTYPEDLANFVLKPLFSFAGSGVQVNISRADLDAIPATERENYLLQEKINYGAVIETPDDPAKVEVRVMFLWPDDDPEPTPTMLLGRMSKGAMMGVDFNKNKTWVGASACFFDL